MVRSLFIGIVLLTLGANRPALAQAVDHLHGPVVRRVYEGPPLSLKGAVDEALERNPTLIALRSLFEATRHRPAQERYLMPPTFEAQIWQWPVTTVNPLNTNMYMFTVQQELPGRGKRALRTTVAEKDVDLASAEIAVRARDVIKDVTRAYRDLAIARRAIDIHLASVGLLRQFADASTIKYATGRTPQQDVLKAVVEMSKLHEDIVMHEEAVATATARLNTLLDRDPEAPIGPLVEPREVVTVPASAELQRLAIERQPELRVAQLSVERAHAALAVVNRDYKPDFFVGGGYMLMPREAGAWTASVGVTWPNAPWSRGRLDAKKAEATADVEAAAANARAVERQIRLAVHEAYVRANAATQRAALLRTTLLPQSEQTLEVSRVAYQTDRVDFLALIDGQRALLDAQLNYYRALSDREIALADLARAVGTDIPDSLDTTGSRSSGLSDASASPTVSEVKQP
jgi:outer membrane protein TolC